MHRYFSTPPVFSAPLGSIDRENGIIQGVTIAKVGPAKGHGGFIDRTFLLQIVDNAASKSAGIKARFGHPNMCSQALGTYLGRFKNYSYLGDKVQADLYLDNTARTAPNGDLFTYVLDMAEQNPDMFGASIVFEIADSVFLTEDLDGKKAEKEYFRLKELRATDIVDDPAATDGLFSVRLNGVEAFPAIATQFLDENPEIMELVFSKPGSLIEFLTNYINNSGMNLSDKIKQNFAAFLESFSVPQATPLDEMEPGTTVAESENSNIGLQSGQTEISDLQSELVERDSSVRDLKSEIANLQSEIANQQSEIANQQSKIENQQSEIANQQSEIENQQSEIANLQSEIENQQSEIVSRQSEIEKLSARPSIPLNVTDPMLNLSTGDQEKDETGKQILSQLPKDLKRKLKQT